MKASREIIIGFLFGVLGSSIFITFMMVFDELYSEAMYCGKDCKYPYPWTQPLPLWDAWVQAFTWICIGVVMLCISVWLVTAGLLRLRRLE